MVMKSAAYLAMQDEGKNTKRLGATFEKIYKCDINLDKANNRFT